MIFNFSRFLFSHFLPVAANRTLFFFVLLPVAAKVLQKCHSKEEAGRGDSPPLLSKLSSPPLSDYNINAIESFFRRSHRAKRSRSVYVLVRLSGFYSLVGGEKSIAYQADEATSR